MVKRIRLLLDIKIVGLIGALGVLVAGAGMFAWTYYGKVLPRTLVLQVAAGGMTTQELADALAVRYTMPEQYTFVYNSNGEEQVYHVPLHALGVSYDFGKTSENAYKQGRSGDILHDIFLIFGSVREPNEIHLQVVYDEEKLTESAGVIAGQVSVAPVYPKASLTGTEIQIHEGKIGNEVKTADLVATLIGRLVLGQDEPIVISPSEIDPTINEMEKVVLGARAEEYIGKKLVLVHKDERVSFGDDELVGSLAATEGYDQTELFEMMARVKEVFEREAQNPHFVFNGGRVEEFQPALAGVQIKDSELQSKLVETMEELAGSETDEIRIEVPVELTPAEFETADVNNLGIRERIGRGHSTFRGSIASRIYNVNLAATRLNGILIKPGEVFSFNGALGDVSKLTGYKEAYVIRDGKTILGDGGGVCQVSTTLFRAVLDAGLPIIERRAHSYRVGYYEQGYAPGLDATVYSPTTDFKFKNNTEEHILIQTVPNTRSLTLEFELYGTNDGRVATTTKPVITESTPPPDDSYVDDPTLPAGEVKQVEYKAWGAKVIYDYHVERGGETIYEKRFYSNFKPWGAVYMRGTGPVI